MGPIVCAIGTTRSTHHVCAYATVDEYIVVCAMIESSTDARAYVDASTVDVSIVEASTFAYATVDELIFACATTGIEKIMTRGRPRAL